MAATFSSAATFNAELGAWDVANVLTMRTMFSGAGAFNGEISAWDVGRVTDMRNMFSYAFAFDVATHAPWYRG